MIEETSSELENALREEATRMSQTPYCPTAAQWLARHRQRVARRRTLGVGAMALVFVLGSLLPMGWNPLTDLRQAKETPVPGDDTIDTTPLRATVVSEEASQSQTHVMGSLPVHVFVVRETEDGTQDIVPAIYVPPRTQSLDITRLSPVEQRAIRTVLGVEEPSALTETI